VILLDPEEELVAAVLSVQMGHGLEDQVAEDLPVDLLPLDCVPEGEKEMLHADEFPPAIGLDEGGIPVAEVARNASRFQGKRLFVGSQAMGVTVRLRNVELATPSRVGGGIKGLFGTGPRRRAKLSEL
jgi:hypothetical protein